MQFKSREKARVLLAGTAMVVTALASGVAMAQDATPVDKVDRADKAAEIIVTGSRLITNGNNSPSPLTVASADTLLNIAPASIAEGLNSLPGLMGSTNPTSNANTGGFNTLNLRGIGSNRGLILIDGRRVSPTQIGSTGGVVDIDVIPQILLKHVDVVTGGASAAYGSDAMSGVVNFVTDTKFTGLKMNLHGGFSKYGDDGKYGGGIAWGTKFAEGNGHFIVGYEYSKMDGFLRSKRPFLSNPWSSMVGSGTAASPYMLVQNARLNSATFGGLINSGPLANLQFVNGGTLAAFNPGTPTSTGAVSTGGDGAYYKGSTAGSAQTAHRATARLEYDITPGITAHASVIYAHFIQSYIQKNELFGKITMGYNNPYLSSIQPQYQALIAAQPAGSTFTFSKMDLGLAPDTFRVYEAYYNADAGLAGKLGAFDWDATYYHSMSRQTNNNYGGLNAGKFYAAINAVSSGGKTVCAAALTNPNYANCVPLNLFGPASEQQAAVNYVTQNLYSTGTYNTNDVNAGIRGPLFNLPAGPVKVALTAEWRRQSYGVVSANTPTDPLDCGGIQYNCTTTATAARYLGGTQAQGGPVAALSPVSQTVIEQAIEAEIPVLSGASFAKDLSINLAGRHAYYDTTGTTWTWKAGLIWKLNDSIMLRATRSRDVRAPNLIDLFAPTSIAQNPYTDLHTNTSGVVTVIGGGNASLTPEKANTLTFGAVFTPQFLPGFSAAIDYYKIDIHNAIVSLSANQAAVGQACELSGGTSSLCSLYTRPLPFSNTTAANFPTAIYNRSVNSALVTTHGIDFELNYARLIGTHRLSARALVTYQPTLLYDQGIGATGLVDVGGAADGLGGLPTVPKWKLVANVNYDVTKNFSVNVQERWRNAVRQNGAAYLVFAVGDVPAVAYTDFNVTMKVNDTLQMYFNVQNLFDKQPPVFASSGGSTQMNFLGGFAQGDDIEGRYFTMGVRARM